MIGDSVEKLIDVVGLYLNPPERAIVFCVDEKSQIQALDRTQRLLAPEKGPLRHHDADYVRNGTTTLFAALNCGRRQADRDVHVAATGIRSSSNS